MPTPRIIYLDLDGNQLEYWGGTAWVPAGSGAPPGYLVTAAITTDYLATITDDVILVDSSGAGPELVVSLPAAAGADGKVFHIKKVDASAVPVKIDPNASEQIDESDYLTINFRYSSARIVCDGTEWWVI